MSRRCYWCGEEVLWPKESNRASPKPSSLRIESVSVTEAWLVRAPRSPSRNSLYQVASLMVFDVPTLSMSGSVFAVALARDGSVCVA